MICPITDPFVRYHGALGSFVRIYVNASEHQESMLEYCKSFPQVEVALKGEEAAEKFEMPLDREGDIVVIVSPGAVIRGRKGEHDLSNLGGHLLRSHGGISKQEIPLLMSRPTQDKAKAASNSWRNYDTFDLVLNW